MNDTQLFERYDWTVDPADKNERIDKFITLQNEDWSRSQVQAWVKEGRVTVNGEPIKNNYKLQAEDEVTLRVPPPKEMAIQPEEMSLDIVYEDSDVVVVNKPRGLVVHPAPGHYSGTLVNGLLAHCKDLSGINGVLRPGIVHRIDKDTSGLLMVAKNDKAHMGLAEQLKAHTVNRKYVALVHGVIPHEMGTIEAPIGRDPKNRQQMAVVFENSKPAVTHFIVLERFKEYTMVELKLETGRTHQIRVHMKYIDYPLAGDPKYGPKNTLELDGQALHAKTLGFIHPRTGEQLEFEAPMPKEMLDVIEVLRQA
ncbi:MULTISPECIES: RluA family pseudouridine synthase [Brevibacillus]|uniref:Pseudouridine synthase n=1 Tax=Brevibacillus brevis (strain 47 / JCM 6285 / NBRC 100599) TaxID=358681 RepID=C0ZG48_BREBN|nr:MULTISPECIES: RluA family pseudouridine synthase [Bacillales]NRR01337.1 RluA family pseudouridine synthase [Brevibacillus sp. RS1.1]NRS47962.1 RluA family pseudouridine synthase [Brevibacillus sp. HB2.2]TQR36280.1 RluA family pseudouridine synthase [Lysinibacillus sp. SDF0063]WGV58152.1 RluA family pseudouridine synthase [Brevibacillus brevis]BAH44757.1 pseudouridine synthase [Brevibacillus brevis NBRC 100599]